MASAVVERLRERRLNIAGEMEAIAKLASDENRQFNGEEQGKWEKLNEDYDQVQARESSAMEQETRSQAADAKFNELYGGNGGNGGNGGTGREVATRSGAVGDGGELRKFLKGDGPRFYDVMPPQGFGRMFESRAAVTATLTAGSPTAGGDTVPTGFYNRLVEHLIQNAAIMQAGVTVINTSGGNPIPVPKTTAHSGGAIVAEGANIGEDDPTFGQVTLNAYKYGMLVKVSRELVDDTGVDLEGYLAREAGQALGNAFGAHAMTGDGASKPHGVASQASLAIQGATEGTFDPSYDDLVDIFHSVISPYRKSQACNWIMNDATVGSVRKLVAVGSGVPLWQPSVQLGVPDLLLSKPVLTDPNLPVAAADAKPILFGDFSRYFVRLAGGIRFERSDDYAFNSDMVTFRALMRADGALVDLTGAIKYYQCADASS